MHQQSPSFTYGSQQLALPSGRLHQASFEKWMLGSQCTRQMKGRIKHMEFWPQWLQPSRVWKHDVGRKYDWNADRIGIYHSYPLLWVVQTAAFRLKVVEHGESWFLPSSPGLFRPREFWDEAAKVIQPGGENKPLLMPVPKRCWRKF